jgi:type I restriction enzyme S subunit
VKPIKYLVTHIGSGKTPSGGAEVYQDSGVLFLRSQNVHDDGLRLDDVTNISEEIDQEMRGSRVLQGDVLLNITGASIGRSCLVAEDIGPANVNQHVCIVRTAERELACWISEYFLSTAIKAQINFSQNGAGREGLNFEQIGNMVIALPPVVERRSICSMLMNNRDRLDTLINKTQRSIELLKERRSALITAAVTGQIDLREAA